MELRAKPIPRLRLARIRSSLASYVHFTHPSSSIPSTTTLQHLSSAYNPLLGPFLDSLSLGMPSVRAPLSFCLLPLLLPPHRSISSSPSLPPRFVRFVPRHDEEKLLVLNSNPPSNPPLFLRGSAYEPISPISRFSLGKGTSGNRWYF